MYYSYLIRLYINRASDPILHLETPLRRNELNTTTKIAIFSSPSFKKLPESHLKVKVLRRNLSKNTFTQLSSSLTDSSSSSSFYDKHEKNDDDFLMEINEVLLKEELDKMRNEKIAADKTLLALTDPCNRTTENSYLEPTSNSQNITNNLESDKVSFETCDSTSLHIATDDVDKSSDTSSLKIETNLTTVECFKTADYPVNDNIIQTNSAHCKKSVDHRCCDDAFLNSNQKIKYTQLFNLNKNNNCYNDINDEDKKKLDLDKNEINMNLCEESLITTKPGANESIAQNLPHVFNCDINGTSNDESVLKNTTPPIPLQDINCINSITLNIADTIDTIDDEILESKSAIINIKNNLSRRQPYRSAKLKHLLMKDQGLLLHRLKMKMSQRHLTSSNKYTHRVDSVKKENLDENNTEFTVGNPNMDCFNEKGLYNQTETDEIKIKDINHTIGSVNRRENKKGSISNVSINVFDESSGTETMSVKENDGDDYESATDEDNVLDNFNENITKNDDRTLIYKKKKGGRPKKIDHTNYESNKIIENNAPKNNDINERFLSKAIYNRLHNCNHLILDHSYTSKNHISINQKYLSTKSMNYGQDLTPLEDSRPGWFGKGMYMRRFKKKRKFF